MWKLNPSALFENKHIELQQRLEKKFNDVNIFNISIDSIKGMIVYFKDRKNKSKNKYRNYKIRTTILKSFDTFAIIATTSTSITLSLTGISFIAIPISTASACALLIDNKAIYEIILNK